MILNFMLGGEIVLVKIEGHSITFANHQTNYTTFYPIDSIALKRDGIIKLHPDLKDYSEPEMRVIALKRFKEYVKGLGTETKIMDYVIDEFVSMGYILKGISRPGWRPQKI